MITIEELSAYNRKLVDENLKLRKENENLKKRNSDEECLKRLAKKGYIKFCAKANEWHKVADGDLPKGEKYGKNSIHRNIYLKDRYGNLYTGNYYPKDETHAEDCFAVEVLEWGFQGSQFCKKDQIAEWCEIPQYEEK